MAKQIIIVSVVVSAIWIGIAIARFHMAKRRLEYQKQRLSKIWEEFRETIRR